MPGTPPLILMSESGAAEVLNMDSDPLGIFSTAVLQRRDLRVSPRDRIFLYSGGLIEATPGASRKVGVERLTEACVRHRLLLATEVTE